jgi:hypothetical protein
MAATRWPSRFAPARGGIAPRERPTAPLGLSVPRAATKTKALKVGFVSLGCPKAAYLVIAGSDRLLIQS